MNKFEAKDAEYKSIPKTASPKSPNEPSEYEDHSYNHRELKPDGTTIYYYDNGVKAIHHPKKTSSTYHRTAVQHHEKKIDEAVNNEDKKRALSHIKARVGHLLAMKKKASKDDTKSSDVEKLYKDFGGADSGAGNIVAVASDPGIFTNTYSGTNKKKAKKSEKSEIEENKKNKKKASGPDKLDKWLKDTEEKSLNLFSFKKTDKKKFPLGRTGGLTPDNSIKTPLEERDMEEWMEARQENAENRAFGISKTKQLGDYVVDLLNDVRKELSKEDEKISELDIDDDLELAYRQFEIEHNQQFEILQHMAMKDFKSNPSRWGINFQSSEPVEKMETDWSKDKKDGKLTNMPFLGMYKKSVEGRRENPPPQVEKQYGAKRSPNPDKNGYRNPPNRRIPDPEE